MFSAFRVCRAFSADHFGKNKFQIGLINSDATVKILVIILALSATSA
jgi:hypothetical protein